MRKRIDFSRENRPYFYYQRVKILHSIESLLFKVDSGYNFLFRCMNEKHNERSAFCPVSESPVAADLINNGITATIANWPVGKSVFFTNAGGALPPPLLPNITYYVVGFVPILLPTAVQLSLTYGGPPVVLLGAGAGVNTMWAVNCPPIGFQIMKVSSGLDEHYTPLLPEYFASPGPLDVGVFAEAAPYNLDAYGVNFSATPRKLAKPYDTLYISGETIQVKITGQKINSATLPEDNLPSFVDVFLVGRHYPDNSLPSWARGGK
jgi:hypothetical protein